MASEQERLLARREAADIDDAASSMVSVNHDATPVAAPQHGIASPLASSMEAAKMREVKNFEDIDISERPVQEGLRPMKKGWQFFIGGVISVWVLFNAIVTTMILLTTFKVTIPAEDRHAFGSENGFTWLFHVITYFPLVFLWTLILLVNNNYSERTFYEYLMRGVIVDFPESGAFGYMVRRFRVILFALLFVLYVVFVLYVLIKYAAPFGTIAIVLNNLVVGIGLLWFQAQTIEDKFVSLTTFIQSFPDDDGGYDNIDTVSLTAAADFLMRLSLAESPDPSYTGLARLSYWRRREFSALSKVLRHFWVQGTIVVLAGLCVLYFYFMDSHLEEARFESLGNPCIRVCVASSNTSMCTRCIEQCVAAFRIAKATQGCLHYLDVPGCHTAHCP